MKYLEDDIKFFSRVVTGSQDGVIASAEQIKDYDWKGGEFQNNINNQLYQEIAKLKELGFDMTPITEQEILEGL